MKTNQQQTDNQPREIHPLILIIFYIVTLVIFAKVGGPN